MAERMLTARCYEPHDDDGRTAARLLYKSQHAERHTLHILISVTDGQEGEKYCKACAFLLPETMSW
jgi:hypothetical protein